VVPGRLAARLRPFTKFPFCHFPADSRFSLLKRDLGESVGHNGQLKYQAANAFAENLFVAAALHGKHRMIASQAADARSAIPESDR
jgi:hypothetical protein